MELNIDEGLLFLASAQYVSSDELTTYFIGLCRLDQSVLVKTIFLGAFASNARVEQLIKRRYAEKIGRQVEKFSRLSRSCVVKIEGTIHYMNNYFVPTDFHFGGNFLNWITSQTDIKVHTVCVAIQHMLRGLNYLHQNGIAHGNLRMSNILFKQDQPESAAIVLDASVKSEMLKVFSPVPLQPEFCPPELMDSVLQLASEWPAVNGGVRNDEQLKQVDELLTPTKQLDNWCAGIIAFVALTGSFPFQGELIAIRESLRSGRSGGPSESPLFRSFAQGVQNLITWFLRVDPTERAQAKDGCPETWFNDELTKNDNRNLLYLIEYGFVNLELISSRQTQQMFTCIRDRCTQL
ncbi:unnamed protein product [Calicophoron daubneyi]|uniref:Protein kinase domain-containing protein n=1 Tax=Calicophoron daubneyi TaxID=300641 RepID=A0AAV2U0Q9_CALDB